LVAEHWLETILAREYKSHRDFFGQEFDLTGFKEALERHGSEAISRWQKLELEPHFLPPVMMLPEAGFPGWKIKPENWYYQQVAGRKILYRQPDGSIMVDKEAFKLNGITVLVDTRLKPQFKNGEQMFKNDNLLGPIIERLRIKERIVQYEDGPQSSRFGVSANEWEEHIKPALAEFLSIEVSQVRLERAIEANVIPQLYPHMPRQEDGQTNTQVWYEEYFRGPSRRLLGGRSPWLGLADYPYVWVGFRWLTLAFRPLVVL